MKIIKVDFDWKLILATVMLVIFILGITIDIVANWDNKAKINTQLLLFGTGIFTLLIIGLTSHAATTLVSFLGIITLIAIGSTSTTIYNSKYYPGRSMKTYNVVPWEFYLIIAISVLILIIVIGWTMYRQMGKNTSKTVKKQIQLAYSTDIATAKLKDHHNHKKHKHKKHKHKKHKHKRER